MHFNPGEGDRMLCRNDAILQQDYTEKATYIKEGNSLSNTETDVFAVNSITPPLARHCLVIVSPDTA
jgi:hypothetical protein